MKNGIREALLAGAWYPEKPDLLQSEIDKYIRAVPDLELREQPLAIISPHAGLSYSGAIAAYAYKAASNGHYDSIVVIGPSHRIRFRGASIFDGRGYKTPLGVVPLERKLAEAIVRHSNIVSFVPDEKTPENSIEIQMPFIQTLFPGTPFVPIQMGTQDAKTCDTLAEIIYSVSQGENILLIASSDFSHYHNYEDAVHMDSKAIDIIKKMDSEGFYRSVEKGEVEACGAGPIRVAIKFAQAKGSDSGYMLKYANSGDVTGDKTGVVGYAALAFYKKDINKKDSVSNNESGAEEGSLTKNEKNELIKIARRSIEDSLSGRRAEPLSMTSENLAAARGAFVTLKKEGRLRGCIGFIEPRKPLHRTVAEMACAAAFDDPRFPPLAKEELEEITIEISALTPLCLIGNISEIEVGRDGIYIVKGFQAGLLLPQVATENGWDRLTFLEQTCRKAGLPSGAWKNKDTRIYTFSAEIFGE
ncbi:MAG: AmmeMemoRadiSam system protein B [Syntrophales bacterium]|jgi:AmmeMemoRadiSam system protein B/AmmeMemoRadiSam system protein A|nr:AmmeMemoRadiSam system protein B [Syntrophales bacterium]MDY0044859.1 AmmeMemoRadiSam system protein B [Syntrophales bacterium]